MFPLPLRQISVRRGFFREKCTCASILPWTTASLYVIMEATGRFPANGSANEQNRGDFMGIIEKMRLDGKCGFVTGGARGIGKATATALAEAGGNVAIVDIDLAEAEKTAAQLAEATGRDVFAVKADVTVPEEVDAMIETILARFGRIDFAHCNAGIAVNEPAEGMSYASWQKVINVNLTGVFLTAQAAGKVMLKQGSGSIINTASMSGHIVNVPQPQCGYNASKAGVISPGYIGTELITTRADLAPLIDQWNALSPIHRMGKPEELQSIVVYLAGDTSSFTTGADFTIDGAFTCF